MQSNTACLVVNAGSSSMKFSVFGAGAEGENDLSVLASGQISGIGTEPKFAAKKRGDENKTERAWSNGNGADRLTLLQFTLDWIHQALPGHALVAAGHRVVHGGRQFSRPTLVTPDVMKALEDLIPLAPLHQPHNVSAIKVLAESSPDLPQVACFDTAFHATMVPETRSYALPRALTEEGVCRYGFHGHSYDFISGKMREIAPEVAKGAYVVAHLGNGASLCAIRDGKCVDTTMGLSTLEGVPMGTRTGSIDPGVLIYLMREKGMDLDAIEELVYKKSGLLGVSGMSNDMRTLEEAERTSPEAAEAVAMFCFRVAKEIAALGASLGGLDGIVFTGGIGENSVTVRSRVSQRLEWLGVRLSEAANGTRGTTVISQPDSRVKVLVVPTDEELTIARQTMQVLAA